MTIFLIEYDRTTGKIVSQVSFLDSERFRADDPRLRKELELKVAGSEHEVVLLEAADEAALRLTHRRYFDDLSGIAKVASS